jgi:cytochrome c biogenesis protein CcmG/thiol:disulfide interchange protein DsbE
VRRLAVIFAVPLLAAALTACMTGGAEVSAADPPDRGDASAFRVPALLSDGDVSLEQFGGMPVVLNFWASWCTPCKKEMPVLQEFAAENPDVAVVGLAVNDTEGDSRRFAQERNIQFPLGVDGDGSVSADYGVTGLPVTVVIDGQGKVASTWFGEITREELDLFAEQLS